MGGGFRRQLMVALVMLGQALFIFPHSALAANILPDLKFTASNTTPNASNIDASISFTLPINDEQIHPSDYILIDLPNYSAITAPLYVEGAYGTPQSSVSGNRVSITNIAVLPGNNVNIVGIKFTNPAVGATQALTLSISDDANGVIIRNRQTVFVNNDGPLIAVTVTIINELSSLILSGYTGPNDFTTLTEGTNTIATTSANASGYFSFSLSGLTPSGHTYLLSSTDSSNQTTSQSSQQVFLLPSTLTSVTGILLSPTIILNKAAINSGDTLIASGTAKPLSTINLFIESPLRSYTVQTDATGLWSYTVAATDTATWQPGQYRAYTNVEDVSGNQSIVSPTINFTVGQAIDTNNPPACGNISHGDLNCDGKTNLTDFSILLFYWHTNKHKADINSDGAVNLTDFSIMMYYFQR